MVDGGDGGDDDSDVTVDVDVPADDRNADDGDTFVVADSEEYNQSRRLKAIHQARADVRKAHREVTYLHEDGYAAHFNTRQQLAARVAYYGSELRPLMEEADWSHGFPDAFPWDNARHFIRRNGRLPPESGRERENSDVYDGYAIVKEEESMEVFRVLNRFARRAGLGLDMGDGNDRNDITEW